jgi:hypothetical protein
MEEINEKAIRAVESIMGPNSAAAKTIADAEKRRGAGQAVKFYQDGNTLYVVPERATLPQKGK